jgi:hypothetical protein
VGERCKNWHENEIISLADNSPAEVRHSMTNDQIDKQTSDLGRVGIRALAVGAQALGALALGALAIGALALGAVAIGQLAIGRSRIKRLEIGELVVKKIRITESLETPTPS